MTYSPMFRGFNAKFPIVVTCPQGAPTPSGHLDVVPTRVGFAVQEVTLVNSVMLPGLKGFWWRLCTVTLFLVVVLLL